MKRNTGIHDCSAKRRKGNWRGLDYDYCLLCGEMDFHRGEVAPVGDDALKFTVAGRSLLKRFRKTAEK